MRTVDVVTEVVIHRPLKDVVAYASDPDNAPNWYTNIKAVEWKTPRPVGLGSRIAFVAQFLGRRIEYTYAVAELVPSERLVMRTSDGPFPMETTYRWEPLALERTRMTLRNRGKPAGFSSWLGPIMAFAIRRANKKDLALLRARLEESGHRE